ncbi:MAG TPA: pitrilysin family protein [Methylomirabilota bacterium]|nr:pitrilysin family protein [Methylomirabilota bacterium]
MRCSWLGLTAILAALLGALAVSVPAQQAVLAERLPNGLTVLVRENPAAPVVAVSLFVRVGSRWETDENAGVSNLLQQLLVKGTHSRSALEIAEAAERIGGSLGASADTDFSEVRGTALARHWSRLLELIADVTLRPSLPAAELESERRIVLSGIRNRQDQPSPLAFDTLMTRLYPEHPYGRPSAGRAPSVQRLDRDAVVAHYQRYYRASRMVLSVSGDVPGREVAREAARRFADARAGDGGPDPALSEAVALADRTVVARPSAQTQVLIGFSAAPMSHGDYAAVKVLATTLGGGMAGRMFTEIRDKQGLAYSSGAVYPSRVGQGFFLAQLGTAPANAGRAEAALLREIDRLRQERLEVAALQRAKSYLLGQFMLDRRTNARLAWYEGFFEIMGVGHDFADRYVRAVEAVTAEDVQRVAGTYLSRPTSVILGPTTP